MMAFAGNKRRGGEFGDCVLGNAGRQVRRLRQRRRARELCIAHAQFAAGIGWQALVTVVALGCDMGSRVRGHPGLSKQEGKYQQKSV